ncbi:phosphatase PAP2 family protein [Microlunatus elymi]|uniref:Phosphatase PAP2 family protein n=1 Tax=Microlunatus elymi TaxID=2596828 RepID=A0A516PVI6_9ACTN|nr:phosphatase PAP2 family protein [Microlunatus elymi]QDP95132.1 phosphatase PAP2 family protein [Microlunatus elymi]
MSGDELIFDRIQQFRATTPALHQPLAAYALWGGLALLACLLIIGWWFIARRADRPYRAVAIAVLTGVGSVVALLANQHLLSPLIARPRPCQVIAGVHPLLACNSDFSMPSDHAVIAGALAAGMILLNRRLGVLAAVLALLLAFSRVYVGVHYPSDVLAGLIFGAAVTVMLILVLRVPVERLARALPARLGILVAAGPMRRSGDRSASAIVESPERATDG